MKSSIETVRDHKERLNKVVLYIQNNLDKSLPLEKLAAIACLSPYHFHRLFTAYHGETLNDFIRRVRLERAASLICHSNFSNEKVTSIAFGAGYETPAAFYKAFRQYFGKTPTEFKSDRNHVVRQYQLHSEPSKIRRTIAPCAIHVIRERHVAFLRMTGAYNRGSERNWNFLLNFAMSKGIDCENDAALLGIPHDCSSITRADNRRYDFCIIVDRDIKPEGEVGMQIVEGGRYAFFPHQGSFHNISLTYRKIFLNWFPKSGEKLRNAPCLEIFSKPPTLNPFHEDMGIEICIPLHKD